MTEYVHPNNRIVQKNMEQIKNRAVRIPRAGVVLACIGIILSCFSVPTQAQAVDEIYLVLSSEALPYRLAADALQSSLQSENLPNRILSSEKLEGLTTQLLQKQYPSKLWVAIGSRAASQLNKLLPLSTRLVYCMVADPAKIGLAEDRELVAGVSVTKPIWEQFAIIGDAIPDLHSIGLLYRSSSQPSMQMLVEVTEELPKGWKLEAVDVDAMSTMGLAIQELVARNVDLIWTKADSSIYNRATVKSLLLASLRNGVPVFGFSRSFVKAGALLGLTADPIMQGQYAASLILNCLGVDEQNNCLFTSGVKLSVNKVVADRLGIVLPEALLIQASDIRKL